MYSANSFVSKFFLNLNCYYFYGGTDAGADATKDLVLVCNYFNLEKQKLDCVHKQGFPPASPLTACYTTQKAIARCYARRYR